MTEETKTPEQEATDWLLSVIRTDLGMDPRQIQAAQIILDHSIHLRNIEMQRETFCGSIHAADNASRTKPDT